MITLACARTVHENTAGFSEDALCDRGGTTCAGAGFLLFERFATKTPVFGEF
jgi:hypothetical protein